MTTGSNLQMDDETIDPGKNSPPPLGLAKLLSVLMAIDGGHCEEH